MDELKSKTVKPTVKVETSKKVTIVRSNGLNTTTPEDGREKGDSVKEKKERQGALGDALTSYLSKLYAWDENKVQGQPDDVIMLAPKKTEEEKLEDKSNGDGDE